MPRSKIDLYKQHEYAATRKPAMVKVSKGCYLALEGRRGAPGTETFTARIGALYGVAFTVKMTRKFSGRQDYSVCKLEAQRWRDDEQDFTDAPKQAWQWKLLIRTPDFVPKEEVDDAFAALQQRRKGREAERVRLGWLSEGRCVQMLHIGPYEKRTRNDRVHESVCHIPEAFIPGPASRDLPFRSPACRSREAKDHFAGVGLAKLRCRQEDCERGAGYGN